MGSMRAASALSILRNLHVLLITAPARSDPAFIEVQAAGVAAGIE